MKRLVLLGAGHAHLLVLKHFARLHLPNVELIVVSPSRWQYYSGMVPGWMVGHYRLDQCRIAVEEQVIRANGLLVKDQAVEILVEERKIELSGGQTLDYDILSIDIGSRSDEEPLHGLKIPSLAVKPIDQFSRQWGNFRRDIFESSMQSHCVVLGGGAAGVELALALAASLNDSQSKHRPISLVTGNRGLLPGFNSKMRSLILEQLINQGVQLFEQRAASKDGKLILADGTELQAEFVIAATASKPSKLLANTGLKLDSHGFILVDQFHRSFSHPEIFAVGDTCSRFDKKISRSGVHAVRAGKVLARNLAAILSGKQELTPFYPRSNTLYLLASDHKTAVGSYGPLTFAGRWVWWIKQCIDQRFVNGF